ncbi:MAG TPA: TetR/AcrR family transcriptional regulator [Bacteroidales bacterium]|nr:TetR/AcrR family transcriptional regulator [Bacteroidales bacterium]
MSEKTDTRKEKTREKIIGAACELFSKNGYHNTQVMDIVKAVGMSAGTIYNHFKDKQDLFDQITMESLENLRVAIRLIREPVDVLIYDEWVKTLQETYNMVFDYVDNNPQQLLIVLRGSFGVDLDLDKNVWKYFQGFAFDVGEDISRWIKKGYIEGIPPMLVGTVVVGMTLQVIHNYLIEKTYGRREITTHLTKIILAIYESYLSAEGKKAFEVTKQHVEGVA